MAAIWDWYDDAYFFFFPVPTVLRCFCGSMLPETASSATTTTGCSLSTIWDERLADLHGQLFAVFIEEHHAVVQVLGFAAIARPASADVFAVLEDFGHALTVQPDDRRDGLPLAQEISVRRTITFA